MRNLPGKQKFCTPTIIQKIPIEQTTIWQKLKTY